MVYLWGNWDIYIQRVWLDSFLLTELTSPYCCICPTSGLPVHRLDRWKFDRGGIPYFFIYPRFPWFNIFHVFTTRGMIMWLRLWWFTALSTIFQLYRGSQFHCWRTRRKLLTCFKSPTKNNVVSSTPRLSSIRTHNVCDDRHWLRGMILLFFNTLLK
jgi:hypothetical protein